MIDPALLEILACPETKQELIPASQELVEKANSLIRNKQLKNRASTPIEEVMDGALIQKIDEQYLYPVRGGIPVLLIDEGIAAADLS